MKIGILTQPLANNYGGILQNWALQQVLKCLGHFPVTYNIPRAVLEEKQDVPRYFWRFVKRISGDKGILFLNGKKQLNQANIPGKAQKRFIADHMNVVFLSKPIEKSFLERNTDVGCFIVGSDQVWRKAFSPFLPNYFLDFASSFDIKRVAYGVSFGSHEMGVAPAELERYKKLAGLFDAVSVRESSGVSICKKQLNCEAKLVLDPTLLVEAKEYKEAFSIKEQSDCNQAAVYILDFNREKKRQIKSICEQLHVKPLFIGIPKKSGYPSVENWLNGMTNCKYVITDSFHGTVFSIIFQKPFTTLVNESRGADRFVTLLTTLGLTSRASLKSANAFIDWDSVYSKLEKSRDDSLRFLKQSLM